MKMEMSDVEGRALHGLIEDGAGDIVVRIDAQGFIIHASSNASQLGIDLNALLLMPHIADFADIDYFSDLSEHVGRVLSGEVDGGWIEFPIRRCACPPPATCDCANAERRRWFALKLRAIEQDDGVPQGALGLLRSIERRHALEGEINARSLTDTVTGLANRHAFCATLRRALAGEGEHAMAVFAIDRMRAVFMQYGQGTADEIHWGFAKFLETMASPDAQSGQEIALLDGDRFGVLLPDTSMRQARTWAEDVVRTFAGLTVKSTAKSSGRAPELTASAGLARVEMTVDWTLCQAELGLVMARAGGGMRVSQCSNPANANYVGLNDSAGIERAINDAVRRAEQRRA